MESAQKQTRAAPTRPSRFVYIFMAVYVLKVVEVTLLPEQGYDFTLVPNPGPWYSFFFQDGWRLFSFTEVPYPGAPPGSPRVNAVPFRTIMDDWIRQTDFMRMILGNLAMLMPLGVFMAYRHLRLRRAVLALLIVSLGIEVFQLFIPGRRTDIDDVILNVTGGILAYLVTGVAMRLRVSRT